MKAVKGKNFFAGVHVPDMKHLASGAVCEVLPLPETVAISVSQSIGKPSIPCVEVGAKVKAGTLIAKADGAISSNIVSSVSGEVTEIKEVKGTNGSKETCIFIKSDGLDEKQWLEPIENPTAEQIKQRICEAGIVGLGGAGFPTAVKASPRTPVDTLVLNGAECEPYLTCDHRIMIEKTDEVVRGARLLAKASGCSNIIVGIEANKPDCIEAFEKYDDIKVVILKKQYPMGSEKQLIYVCTGKKVGLGKLPSDVGVIVNNVGTAFAVCEAVELGKPLYESVITVSGGAIANPKNLWVRLGTPFSNIIDYCGGESVEPKKVVLGGPMTGAALASYDAYTKKTCAGILLMTEKETSIEEPTPCLNCGKCADVCPMYLMPMNTAFYAAAGEFELAGKLGGTMNCVECGACEYICPAKRPLIQAIRKTKAELRKKM